MSHPWLAALPYHLAAELLAQPDISPLERIQYSQAVSLFADISGFTPMSEALGVYGPAGTEELSTILNRSFGAMIGHIHAYGGSVGKIAGDAILAVFPCITRTRRSTLRRAIQCALDMQADMPHETGILTRAGRFPLTMKVGIGIGTLHTISVGIPAIRMEYLLTGSAIDRCVEAEQHSPKGAVVLSDTLLPLLGQAATQLIAPGFYQVLHLHRRPAHAPHPPLPTPPATMLDTLAAYLPATIAQRLAAAQTALVDEHRTITTVFMCFTDLDTQNPAARSQLQAYLSQVIRTIQRYDGTLRQIEVGDKGSLFIALFGAPQAHEDDAERALRCVLDLCDLSATMGLNTHTGIATGRVFCGLVGSRERLDYAAIGDTINVAARLMSAAQPNQILLTEPTRLAVRSVFPWKELPPIALKGKRDPLPVHTLDRRTQRTAGRLQAPSYVLPMIGRQRELAQVQSLLAQTLAGRGQIVNITAEAGMGKSRLVAELLRFASRQPLIHYTSECLSYATTSSYLVWQSLLQALFQLTSAMDREATEQQVHDQIAMIDATLIERLPLLNVVVGTAFAETDWTRSLDAKLRKSALEMLVVTCLRHWSRTRPLLLVLEDCHWLDELSRDLLTAIAAQLEELPVLLVVTMRPLDPGQGNLPLQRMQRLPWYHEILLGEFTATEAEQLIALKLTHLFGEGIPANTDFVARLQERAQGNPFYLDELVNLIHERGIDPRNPSALESIELPDTLQRLILSRIDQLAEGPKLALKVASVIGRLFKASWLWAIYPSLGHSEQVIINLASLQQQELTQLERREPEVEYLFKHLITREVAYESLSHGTRSALHEQVGQFIEQTYADEIHRWIDLLAYHYGQSTNVSKQRLYFQKAAVAAAAVAANEAAITYYERLLPLLEGAEKVLAWLELCRVQIPLGLWQAAEQNARAALELAEALGDMMLQTRCLHVIGQNLCFAGYTAEGLPYLHQAYERCSILQDHKLAAALQESIGNACYAQGRYEEALTYNKGALRSAIESGDAWRRAMALNSMGIAYSGVEEQQEAIGWFEQALAIVEELNDLHWIGAIQQNIMITLAALGDYQKAIVCGRRSLTIARQIGHDTLSQLVLLNVGIIYQAVGAYQPALAYFQGAILLDQVMTSPRFLGMLLIQAAVCYSKLGQDSAAERLFRAGLEVARATKQLNVVSEGLYEQARWFAQKQRYTDSEAAISEALALLPQERVKGSALFAHLFARWLRVVREEEPPASAIATVETFRAHCHQEHQQAAIAYTIWQIDSSQQAARQEAAGRYRALYERTPNIEYRERYAALTGEWLPDSPLAVLPELPEVLSHKPAPVDALIRPATLVLAELERRDTTRAS